jgi:hypothetical protein
MARRGQGITTMINRREFGRLIGGAGIAAARGLPGGRRQGAAGRHRRRRPGRAAVARVLKRSRADVTIV